MRCSISLARAVASGSLEPSGGGTRVSTCSVPEASGCMGLWRSRRWHGVYSCRWGQSASPAHQTKRRQSTCSQPSIRMTEDQSECEKRYYTHYGTGTFRISVACSLATHASPTWIIRIQLLWQLFECFVPSAIDLLNAVTESQTFAG